MRPGPFLLGAALTASLSGCATVGRPDLSSERCADDFTRQLSDVISGAASPVSFQLESPSGVSYGFTIHHTSQGCLLRLYYQGGPASNVTNNLTYIATRPLARCECAKSS
jgi:hypothetical protein